MRKRSAPPTAPWAVGALHTSETLNPKLPGEAGLSPVGRTRTAHSPAPCRMAATSAAVHKHGKTTVAPSVARWYVNMFSLGACSAPCAAWRLPLEGKYPKPRPLNRWRRPMFRGPMFTSISSCGTLRFAPWKLTTHV